MINSTLEKAVKVEFKKRLSKYDFWYFMPPASTYGRRGIPDFICCVNGYFFAIEAKRPDKGIKGLTPLQLLHQHEIFKSNGHHHVIWNDETIDKTEKEIQILLER